MKKYLLLFCGFVIALFPNCVRQTQQAPSPGEKAPLANYKNVKVDPGSKEQACEYLDSIFRELNIQEISFEDCKEEYEEHTIDMMLAYLGYNEDGLRARNLHNDPSQELMRRSKGSIVASRFFAPKITDASKESKDSIDVGWRKVVHLTAKRGSRANANGILHGYLLFNIFQGTNRSVDPFDPGNQSQTTQLILVRHPDSRLKHPVYFFTYGTLEPRNGVPGKMITYLTASFDARAPNLPPDQKYYTPHSCAQCHGGLKPGGQPDFAAQKLNYLDTDHLFDRTKPGDDFDFIADQNYGVLYDGGKNTRSTKFKVAFEVIRRLNQGILEQSLTVDPDGKSFQVRALKKWQELHKSNHNHIDNLFLRSIDEKPKDRWLAADPVDRELLPLLNRYCFRCHSSLIYNIFERNEVAFLADEIPEMLEEELRSKRRMPQDRILDQATIKKIKELVEKLEPRN